MTKISDVLLKYQKDFFFNKKKRKIWISSRQVGKSFTLAALLCYKALQKKNGLSLCVSVNSRSASEIIQKCKLWAEAINVASNGQIPYSASFDSIKWENGSRVMSLPSTSDSLRGWSAQCVCIDEAAYVYQLDDILQGIGPTLTRDPNSELILATTPAGKNGPFYDLYTRALDDEDWYVQQTTILDAQRDGLKIDIESLRSLCPDPQIFDQEYMCRFSSSYGSLIDDESILDFYEDDIQKQEAIYFAADIGRTHDKTAIVIAKVNGDVTYIDDIIILNKCEYQKQLDIFKSLNTTYKFTGGYIDAGGIGSAVAEFANKQISAKIKGLSFTASNKTQMYERIRDRIFQRKIKFNSKFKKLLIDDIRNVSRIVSEDGSVKFVAGRGDIGHSDIVSSLALVLQAIHDNPVSSSKPFTYFSSSRLGTFSSRL